MQGTGSQANPYRPENWTDFLSVCNLSVNVYIKWADNPVTVDFNDIAPEGVTETINIKGQVNFNGLTIKNVHAKNTMPNASNFAVFTVAMGSEIKNVVFENVYLDSIYGLMSVAHALDSNTYIHDINIAGQFFNTQSVFKDSTERNASGGNYFYRIGMKLYVRTSSAFYPIRHVYGKNYISNSTIDFDLQARNVYLGSNDTLSTAFTGNNLYLGTMKATSTISLNQGKHDFFDTTVTGTVYASSRTDSGGLSVYNSDKMSISSAVAGMAGCTTAQLHDAQYLNQIGFAIGV